MEEGEEEGGEAKGGAREVREGEHTVTEGVIE
jgi:hypothetical protein